VKARRLMFWGAVGLVSITSSFLLAAVANKTNQPGLQKFRTFTYGAPPQ
jgi:hypothetical protein